MSTSATARAWEETAEAEETGLLNVGYCSQIPASVLRWRPTRFNKPRKQKTPLIERGCVLVLGYSVPAAVSKWRVAIPADFQIHCGRRLIDSIKGSPVPRYSLPYGPIRDKPDLQM